MSSGLETTAKNGERNMRNWKAALTLGTIAAVVVFKILSELVSVVNAAGLQ
jgi:hypothetical protein